MQSSAPLIIRGFRIYKDWLDSAAQAALVDALRPILKAAPLYRPMTPRGKAMSVRMTSAGDYGWFTDRDGYRYIDRHPSGVPWPAIPQQVLDIWTALCTDERMPECCLINYYDETAKLGLHQDKDEADFAVPVLSLSLGDPAVFRMGGLERKGPTRSTTLASGDLVVIGGAARLAFHGVDRIKFGESALLAEAPVFGAGRINVTLRRAAPV